MRCARNSGSVVNPRVDQQERISAKVTATAVGSCRTGCHCNGSVPQEDHVWVQNDDRLAVEVPILQPVRQRVPAASPGADVGQSRRRCGPVPAQMWAYRRSFAAPLVRARACSSVAAVIPDRCDARAWRHGPERAGGEADGRFVGGYESVGSPASSVSLYGLYLIAPHSVHANMPRLPTSGTRQTTAAMVKRHVRKARQRERTCAWPNA